MTNFPTDEQIYELWDEVGQYFALYDDVKNTVREALNRWSTPDPIALEDREPHHTDLDEYGSCWWWDDVDGVWEKSGMITVLKMNNKLDCPHKYTHWLPHWAIKLPQEKEID